MMLFGIAILISSIQTLSHIYSWIHPKSSVLDAFNGKTIIKTESSKNINELMVSYREAKKAVQNYEEINGKMDNIPINIEPYQTEAKIKNEIISREKDQMKLTELKFYWISGLLCFLVGLLISFRFNYWLGFSGIFVGISLMLYWTSPLSLNEQSGDYRLTLSVATFLIIVALGLIIDKKFVIMEKMMERSRLKEPS